MNRLFLSAVTAAVVSLPAFGQAAPTALDQPLSNSELMRTLDGFGAGDPARKAPLSLTQAAVTNPSTTPPKKETREAEGATEITAKEAAFDQKTHQAVFLGDVEVKNPQFNLSCDKLTAFLKQGEKGNGKPPGNGGSGKPPGKSDKNDAGTGGLEKAIAEGSVVITQEKVDASGELTRNVGRAARAVFEAGTGDITLTGRPVVEQGINTIVSTDDSTVMILNREGRMRVIGPHKSVIQDTADNAR